MLILVFFITFIDIGEIGCLSIPKCHWMVIVVNLVKQTWFICMMLPVGVVLCMLGQYRVLPHVAAIIDARRHGMIATMHCRRSTGISAHLSSMAWWSSTMFWGRLSIMMISPHNSSQLWSMGLQSGDLVCCSILVMLLREGNQVLPEHSEVWCNRLGSGSYPRNAAQQMTLRCFEKYRCRTHHLGIINRVSPHIS